MIPRERPFPVTHPPIAVLHTHDVGLSSPLDAHERGTPVNSRMLKRPLTAAQPDSLQPLSQRAASSPFTSSWPSVVKRERVERTAWLFAHDKRDEPGARKTAGIF